MSTKRSGRQPLSQAEALVFLRSAVGELLTSGFRVGARNGADGLIVTIRGAAVMYHNDRADFVPQLADVPQAHMPQSVADVPQAEHVP